ncbi:helix-turn-helix transcriptional regulator [Iamia sp.]|uniref:helix-turn-helix domain-containing protein n=1 Tax=Iamia sp. TaxID=2722710 RepID=UPI002C32A81A|nr:helix-turn-helix transcriptional regulator [Iamia sp.]HXH57927.1 helix-turn-helix transcriptional regulator [Iamia sp.]
MTVYAPPPHVGWQTATPEPVQVRSEAVALAAVLTRIRTIRPPTSSRTCAGPCLSVPDLAALAGIHWTALYRLEAGERTPKAATVRALCEALGATPEERAQLFLAAGYVDMEAGR